jgi:hypothetical protein
VPVTRIEAPRPSTPQPAPSGSSPTSCDIVTGIPGAAFPLHLLDARMVAGHPHVPLFDNQGLGTSVSRASIAGARL